MAAETGRTGEKRSRAPDVRGNPGEDERKARKRSTGAAHEAKASSSPNRATAAVRETPRADSPDSVASSQAVSSSQSLLADFKLTSELSRYENYLGRYRDGLALFTACRKAVKAGHACGDTFWAENPRSTELLFELTAKGLAQCKAAMDEHGDILSPYEKKGKTPGHRKEKKLAEKKAMVVLKLSESRSKLEDIEDRLPMKPGNTTKRKRENWHPTANL